MAAPSRAPGWTLLGTPPENMGFPYDLPMSFGGSAPGEPIVYVVNHPSPQAAADVAAGKRLVFPAGVTYTLVDLLIPAGCTVEGNGSTLKFADNSTTLSSSDALLRVGGSDVTIDGLNFDGNSANQGGVWVQHRHCIRVQGAYSNVEVKNCDFVNLIGDGVYINTQTNFNIHVHDCTFAANYDARNGVSIVTGDTVEINNNTFTTISRSGMPGHIDIEANGPTEHLAHIDVHDNTLIGGTTAGTGTLPGIVYSGFQNAAANDVKIRNNDISGTRFTCGTLAIGINGGPDNAVTGLVFDGNTVHDIKTPDGIGSELDYWITADVINSTFTNVDYGVYNFKACMPNCSGNTFSGVFAHITNDDPHCAVSTVLPDVYVVDFATVQDAADAAAGRHLIFPPSTTYTLARLAIRAGTYIEGNNSTLKFPNNSTTTGLADELLRVTGDGVTVDNLNFDANSANQTIYSGNRHCVRVDGAYSDVQIKNCDFTNLIGDGVFVNTQTDGNITVGPSNTFTASYDNRYGINVMSGDTVEVHSNTLTNCCKVGLNGGPINVEPGVSTDHMAHIDVHGNTVVGGSTAGAGTMPGVSFVGYADAPATDIKFRLNDISGTRFTCGTLAIGNNGGPFNAVTGLVFDGNTIHGIAASGAIGSELDYWIGANVINSTFNGMDFGIYNYRACLGTSTGNTFTSVGTTITNDTPHCS